MNTAIQALTVLLPALYLITTVLFGMSFAGSKGPQLGGWRVGAFVTVVSLHITLFWMRAQVVGGFPITGTWQVLSALLRNQRVAQVAHRRLGVRRMKRQAIHGSDPLSAIVRHELSRPPCLAQIDERLAGGDVRRIDE